MGRCSSAGSTLVFVFPEPTVAITITTLGRRTLAATLESIRREFERCYIVADPRGDVAGVKRMWKKSGTIGGMAVGEGKHTWGNRNGLRHATTSTHLAWIDDDDAYIEGAGETVRAALRVMPESIHVFCTEYPNGKLLPPAPGGPVATCGIIVPNAPWVPQWSDERAAAQYFLDRARRACPITPKVVWHNEVIARVRPHDLGWEEGW